jgi:hypothetical protein
MAVESPIGPRDGWFTGEDKTLKYVVAGDTDGIETWLIEWALYARSDPTTALITRTNTAGVAGTAGDPTGDPPPIVTVFVPAEETVDLVPDEQYSFVLRRTDPGFVTVLSYGTAVLRSAVVA